MSCLRGIIGITGIRGCRRGGGSIRAPFRSMGARGGRVGGTVVHGNNLILIFELVIRVWKIEI